MCCDDSVADEHVSTGIIDVTIRKMKTKRTMNTMVLLRAICLVVKQSSGVVDVVQAIDDGAHESGESAEIQEAKFRQVYHSLDEQGKRNCDQLKEFFSMFDQVVKMVIVRMSNVCFSMLVWRRGNRCHRIGWLDARSWRRVHISRFQFVNETVRQVSCDVKLFSTFLFILENYNRSGDGSISFPEFYAYMRSRMDAKEEDTKQVCKL